MGHPRWFASGRCVKIQADQPLHNRTRWLISQHPMDRITACAHPTHNPLFPAMSRKFVGYMGWACSCGKIAELEGTGLLTQKGR
jgi:hypothetical protein